ncbi:hypothetical protein Tco_0053772 [Tanacetum coccineum]
MRAWQSVTKASAARRLSIENPKPTETPPTTPSSNVNPTPTATIQEPTNETNQQPPSTNVDTTPQTEKTNLQNTNNISPVISAALIQETTNETPKQTPEIQEKAADNDGKKRKRTETKSPGATTRGSTKKQQLEKKGKEPLKKRKRDEKPKKKQRKGRKMYKKGKKKVEVDDEDYEIEEPQDKSDAVDKENFKMSKGRIGLVEVIEDDDNDDGNEKDAEKQKLREKTEHEHLLERVYGDGITIHGDERMGVDNNEVDVKEENEPTEMGLDVEISVKEAAEKKEADKANEMRQAAKKEGKLYLMTQRNDCQHKRNHTHATRITIHKQIIDTFVTELNYEEMTEQVGKDKSRAYFLPSCGESATKWKTDIVQENNRHYLTQMTNMRMRYTTKNLMHEMNTKRGLMSEYANKFGEDNKEEEKVKKMVEDDIKKRITEGVWSGLWRGAGALDRLSGGLETWGCDRGVEGCETLGDEVGG